MSCTAVAAMNTGADGNGRRRRTTKPAARAWVIILLSACGPDAGPPAEPVLNAEARLAQGTIVEAAPRLFTGPELDSLQRVGDVPATLVVTPDTLVIAPGEAVPLSRLVFEARTADGEPLPSVPIRLSLDTDVAAIESDSLRGVRTGESMLWVRSLVGRDDTDRGRPILVIVR